MTSRFSILARAWPIVVGLVAACSPDKGIAPPLHTEGDRYAITDVTVISMTESGELQNQSVVVRNGKVVKIALADKIDLEGAFHRIDGKDKYLIPGLVDMHTHVRGPEALKLNLAHGVTTVRNMWGTPEILELRDRVASGEVLGPEIVTVSPVIDNDPPSMPGMTLLTDPDEADPLVAEFKEQGYSGLKTYRLLEEDVYVALMAAADKYEMAVEGHIPEAIDVSRAIELGHDVIEHATGVAAEIVDDAIPYSPAFWSTEMVELAARADAGELTYEQAFRRDKLRELAKLAARNGTAVSVTFQAVGLRALTARDRFELRSHPQISYLEPAYENYWFVDDMSSVLPGDLRLTDEEIESLEPYVTTEFGNWVRILAEEGVLLLGGTDAPNPGLFHGYSLHDELANLVTWANMSRKQAIETVTTNAAKYWGRTGEIGVVAVGADADLVLLSANPLENIRNTLEIEGVMVNGHWLERAKLDEMLQDVAETFAAARNE